MQDQQDQELPKFWTYTYEVSPDQYGKRTFAGPCIDDRDIGDAIKLLQSNLPQSYTIKIQHAGGGVEPYSLKTLLLNTHARLQQVEKDNQNPNKLQSYFDPTAKNEIDKWYRELPESEKQVQQEQQSQQSQSQQTWTQKFLSQQQIQQQPQSAYSFQSQQLTQSKMQLQQSYQSQQFQQKSVLIKVNEDDLDPQDESKNFSQQVNVKISNKQQMKRFVTKQGVQNMKQNNIIMLFGGDSIYTTVKKNNITAKHGQGVAVQGQDNAFAVVTTSEKWTLEKQQYYNTELLRISVFVAQFGVKFVIPTNQTGKTTIGTGGAAGKDFGVLGHHSAMQTMRALEQVQVLQPSNPKIGMQLAEALMGELQSNMRNFQKLPIQQGNGQKDFVHLFQVSKECLGSKNPAISEQQLMQASNATKDLATQFKIASNIQDIQSYEQNNQQQQQGTWQQKWQQGQQQGWQQSIYQY